MTEVFVDDENEYHSRFLLKKLNWRLRFYKNDVLQDEVFEYMYLYEIVLPLKTK